MTTKKIMWRIQINNKLKEAKKLDKKIKKDDVCYEWIKTLPLQKHTEEWISEIFDRDEVYQFVKNIWDKKLIKKFINGTLTIEEYHELKIWVIKAIRQTKKDLYDVLGN